jgi:hypothetical protein
VTIIPTPTARGSSFVPSSRRPFHTHSNVRRANLLPRLAAVIRDAQQVGRDFHRPRGVSMMSAVSKM